ATNLIDNSGSISIVANAHAVAADVLATATAGITESVIGPAYAQAYIDDGIAQSNAFALAAHSTETLGGGTTYTGQALASSTMINSGSVKIGALAAARGGVLGDMT